MLNSFLIVLLQIVAGAPETAAATEPAAIVQETTEAAAAPEAPAQTQDAAQPAAPQMRRERRCREVEITGRRMPQRVCTNVMVPVDEPAQGGE